MKPDIRPDTGYEKGRISGWPDIQYNPKLEILKYMN